MGILTVLQNFLSKIAVALITIFAGFIIAKLAHRIVNRVMIEAEINRILTAAGLKTLSDTIGSIAEYFIYTATLLIVLQQFGLTKLVLGIIGLIAVIVIGFSLLLAIRDFIPNFVAGMFIRKTMKKHLGKKVQLGGIKGRLERIGPVASVIKNKDEHHIPHMWASKRKLTRLQAS
jgi:small-conductance mechanosensitive channel